MKAFIISIILLLLIVVLACANAAYVQHATQSMKELAIAATDEKSSDTAVSELKEYWEKHKGIISLSANYKQTDIVSEELLRFETAHSFSNEFALEQSLVILCDALDDIARCEKLSFRSIL